MKQMVATEQIEEIKSDEQVKDLAWESISEDHGEDVAGTIVNVVNQAIEGGLIEVGGKMYLHHIRLNLNSNNYYYILIATPNRTAFTTTTLREWLYENNFRRASNGLPVLHNLSSSGVGVNPPFEVSGNDLKYQYIYLFASSSNISLTFIIQTISFNGTTFSVSNNEVNSSGYNVYEDTVSEM